MNKIWTLIETLSNGHLDINLVSIGIMCVILAIFIIINKNPIVSLLFLIGLSLGISLHLVISGLGFIGLSNFLVYFKVVSMVYLLFIMSIIVRSLIYASYISIRKVLAYITRHLQFSKVISILFTRKFFCTFILSLIITIFFRWCMLIIGGLDMIEVSELISLTFFIIVIELSFIIKRIIFLYLEEKIPMLMPIGAPGQLGHNTSMMNNTGMGSSANFNAGSSANSNAGSSANSDAGSSDESIWSSVNPNIVRSDGSNDVSYTRSKEWWKEALRIWKSWVSGKHDPALIRINGILQDADLPPYPRIKHGFIPQLLEDPSNFRNKGYTSISQMPNSNIIRPNQATLNFYADALEKYHLQRGSPKLSQYNFQKKDDMFFLAWAREQHPFIYQQIKPKSSELGARLNWSELSNTYELRDILRRSR